MRCSDPTNSPIRVGSLTAGKRGNMSCRSAVTKSPEGNGQVDQTRNQSEGRGKFTGRRTTNVCKHRKGEPLFIADRSGYFGSRASVLWVKADVMWEETGELHHISRRCKRRRHVKKDSVGNWGDPVGFQSDGVTTNRWVHIETKNQRSLGSCCRNILVVKEQVRISRSIRRKAESGDEALQEVGGGHSSEEGVSNTTALSEGPLVCVVFSKQHKFRA